MSRPHGTYAAYRKDGCRCDACRRANMRRSKAYRLATGADRTGRPERPRSIPGERIRTHLATLTASGWTRRDIADATGITRNRVGELARGYRSDRVTLGVASRILALEPLTPVDIDPVVIDRLIAGDDWKTLNATRGERIAAAERLWHHWRPIRERQHADGTAPQWLDGPSLADIERRFSLRAGRDFRRTPDETPTRGAA